jgi:lysozyme family protein
MTDFDAWLSFAVGDGETEPGGEEGGLSWDTGADNPTYRGLQRNEVDKAVGRKLTLVEFRTICTRTFIGRFTQVHYWNAYRVDLLPSGPDVLYMDGVFNGGGVENLQAIINYLCLPTTLLSADGIFGKLTLAAMAGLVALPDAQIIAKYSQVAEMRYRWLAQQPRFAPDLAGWLGRLGRCKELALKIAGAPAEGETA